MWIGQPTEILEHSQHNVLFHGLPRVSQGRVIKCIAFIIFLLTFHVFSNRQTHNAHLFLDFHVAHIAASGQAFDQWHALSQYWYGRWSCPVLLQDILLLRLSICLVTNMEFCLYHLSLCLSSGSEIFCSILLDHDHLSWSCWAHLAVMGTLPGALCVNSLLEVSSSEGTSGQALNLFSILLGLAGGWA